MEPPFKDESEVNAYVSQLSNEEISRALKTLQCANGPVTRTTRTIYKKRLIEALCRAVIKNTKKSERSNGYILSEHEQSKGDCKPESDIEQLEMPVKCYKGNEENMNKEESNIRPNKCFFAVKVLPVPCQEGPFVFEDRAEMMKFLKSHPGSRFKIFNNLEEARKFSRDVDYNGAAFTRLREDKKEEEPGDMHPSSPLQKESLPFSSIRCQEFVVFRKALEKGDIATAKELIWSNPRYLIGNGDNPTILQEGCRYNALHVCCRSNQLESCRLVVDAITNHNFYRLLFDEDMPEKRQARMDFLVDMYLNNREKGGLDTPLHFACKFGFKEIVKYLVSQPMIDKEARNADGLTPREVIGARANGVSKHLVQSIESAFEDMYYILVIRTEDNSEPPQVSLPFCPTNPLTSLVVPSSSGNRHYRDLFTPSQQCFFNKDICPTLRNVKALSTCSEVSEDISRKNSHLSTLSPSKSCMKRRSPTSFDCSETEEHLSIDMNTSDSTEFSSSKSSRCESNSGNSLVQMSQSADHETPKKKHHPGVTPCSTPDNFARGKVSVLCKTPTNKQLVLLADPGSETSLSPYAVSRNGMERQSTLASKSSYRDMDKWEKLVNTPIFSAREIPRKIRGIAGPMTLAKSEQFRQAVLLNRISSRHKEKFDVIKRTDSSKGLERVCRFVADSMGVSWSEYWSFLEVDVNLATPAGLRLFEEHMASIVDFSVSVCETEKSKSAACSKEEGDDELSNTFVKLLIKSPPQEDCDCKKAKEPKNDKKKKEKEEDEEDEEEFYELNSRQNLGMYIYGDIPTRADIDAFRAIEHLGEELKLHPHIYCWFVTMKSTSEEERSRWLDQSTISHILSTPRVDSRGLFRSIEELSFTPDSIRCNLRNAFDED